MGRGESIKDVRRRLRERGAEPLEWSNRPGDRYAEHEHPYRKVLVCVAGSITFHLASGDRHLEAGDELELAPRTPHSATVGPDGVTCLEIGVT